MLKVWVILSKSKLSNRCYYVKPTCFFFFFFFFFFFVYILAHAQNLKKKKKKKKKHHAVDKDNILSHQDSTAFNMKALLFTIIRPFVDNCVGV